jgi:hypothetical protein
MGFSRKDAQVAGSFFTQALEIKAATQTSVHQREEPGDLSLTASSDGRRCEIQRETNLWKTVTKTVATLPMEHVKRSAWDLLQKGIENARHHSRETRQ